MLEIKFVRQNLSIVQAAMAARGHHADLDTFKKCDDERRDILQEIESLRHQRNVVSDRIAEMRKAGDDTEVLVVEMRGVSSRIKELDKKLSKNQETVDTFLLGLPNIAHPSVPVGADETDNFAAKGSAPPIPGSHADQSLPGVVYRQDERRTAGRPGRACASGSLSA